MVEGIKAQQLIEKASKTSEGVERAASQPLQAGEDDLARLDQALGDEAPPVDGASMDASQVQGTAPPEEPQSMGDLILDSLDRLRTTHNERMEGVKRSLQTIAEREELSPMEALRVQAQLFEANLQVETAAKVVDKADQGVSTLLRSQS
jgi:hypothetical protein